MTLWGWHYRYGAMGLALWGWLWGWHYRYGAMGLTPQVPRGDPKSRRSPVPKHTEPQKEPRPVPPPQPPHSAPQRRPHAHCAVFLAQHRVTPLRCVGAPALRGAAVKGGGMGAAQPHTDTARPIEPP